MPVALLEFPTERRPCSEPDRRPCQEQDSRRVPDGEHGQTGNPEHQGYAAGYHHHVERDLATGARFRRRGGIVAVETFPK